MLIRFRPCWALAGLLAAVAGHAQSVQISDGKVFDRQASMAADGAVVLIVTERTTAPGSGLDGSLSLLRSTDGGQSFAIPAPTLFPQTGLRHPTLIRWEGHWVLVFEEGIGNDPVLRLRRALSTDGQTFVRDPDPLALGWPAGGQRQPQLLDPGDGTLLLSYVHEGDCYLAVSTDGGAHFDALRTRTATGAATGRLAYRAADQRYVLAYASTDPLQRIGVRSTLDLRDWNGPTVWLTAADLDRESPWPVIQGSGQLAVVYAGLAPEDGRSDLYLRTSMDLIDFSSERPLTRGLHSETRPLAYAVPDPDRFGLIYSRSFSPCGSSYCWLFRDAGVLADTLLADGFDLGTP